MRFSVIVPVYGVEKYLDECVRSILSQTYTDFELILVDDKSPDSCPEMCDAYAKEDGRVRVIHKEENEGLGFARNSGMEIAQGDYVLFVDSDDTIDSKTLETYSKAIEDEPDVIACGLALCKENKRGKTIRRTELRPQAFYANTPQGKADVFAMLTENRVFQYACTKAYKRVFLLSAATKFERTKLIEDFLFNIEILTAANKVRTLDFVYYSYRKPEHETLASKYSPEFFELSKRRYRLEQLFLQTFDKENRYANLIQKDYIKHCISSIVRNKSKSAKLTGKEQKEKIFEIVTDPLTVEVVQAFEPQGMAYKLIRRMFLKKRIGCIYFSCSLAARIKTF